ncbi:MAG TPA: type II secretion system protein M, partial [Albitalea sp.]
ATIAFQGDRATLTLSGVSGEALREWLGEARSAARARPVDVQLTRTGSGYAGLVVVTLGAGAS